MVLHVEKLTKSFGEKRILSDISFSVRCGEILGFLGRNGVGKTTTFRIIMNIFQADTGCVLLNSKPLNYSRVRLGYLPEERGLYSKLKVGEQMIYLGELRGMSRQKAKRTAQTILDELDAIDFWNKKLDILSKGNQQKIQFAVSLMNDPDILILDEPFTGLDPINAVALKRVIDNRASCGKIVIFSSHQMPYVDDFCERICILNEGKVVLDGRIKDLKRSHSRNRIAVWPRVKPYEYYETIMSNDDLKSIEMFHFIERDKIEFSIKHELHMGKLLKVIGSYLDHIDRFQIVEPSLEDIFIMYAENKNNDTTRQTLGTK